LNSLSSSSVLNVVITIFFVKCFTNIKQNTVKKH